MLLLLFIKPERMKSLSFADLPVSGQRPELECRSAMSKIHRRVARAMAAPLINQERKIVFDKAPDIFIAI